MKSVKGLFKIKYQKRVVQTLKEYEKAKRKRKWIALCDSTNNDDDEYEYT